MSQSFTVVVTTDASNNWIHNKLSPAGTGLAGNTSAPEWLRNMSDYFAAASQGNQNVSVAYTDSVGTVTIHSGL